MDDSEEYLNDTSEDLSLRFLNKIKERKIAKSSFIHPSIAKISSEET
jgi:hypothetical protein